MTHDALVSQLRTLAGVDVSPADASTIVNSRHKMFVAQAKWLMKQLAIGTTTADEPQYAVDDSVVDIEVLVVGTAPYKPVGAKTLFDLKFGLQRLVGAFDNEGVFAPAFSATGVESVELYPAPDESGTAITALAAVIPADISGSDSPSVPEDLHSYLRDGCVADGLRLVDERLGEADVLEARFAEGVALLSQRKNSRLTSGPSTISVRGVHF